MAEAAGSIFNKKAEEKLRNPDDLDKYVQVTNPSVWVVLAACLALLLGLLCWGIFGSVSTSVSTKGVAINGDAYCFVNGEDATRIKIGDAAIVDGEPMDVKEISYIPLSRDEVKKKLGNDYLVATLVDDDWAYAVKFSGGSELTPGKPVAVTITTERVAPITLVLQSHSEE